MQNCWLLPLAFASSAFSQGLQAPWNVRDIVAALRVENAKVAPVLAQVNPQGWVEQKGAPSTYIVQYQSAQQQVKDVDNVTNAFRAKTESLSTGIDLYFRLESLERAEQALEQGARQYDVRANADAIARLAAESFDSRQQLREYLRELASSTEENFRIADSEAQRCRSSLSKPATASKARK